MKLGNTNHMGVTHSCHYYVAFRTKWGRRLLSPDIAARFLSVCDGLSSDEVLPFRIYDIRCTESTVSFLASCDPFFGIHRCVKRLKSESYRILKGEFPKIRSRVPCLWTNRYFVATVGMRSEGLMQAMEEAEIWLEREGNES